MTQKTTLVYIVRMVNQDIVMKLRIPAELAAKVDSAAKSQDRTRHNLIIVALRQWLSQQSRKPELNGRGGK